MINIAIILYYKFGATYLHIAAESGNSDVLNFLLTLPNSKFLKLLDSKDQSGSAPLHVAARFGKLAAVEELIKAGADVNATDLVL